MEWVLTLMIVGGLLLIAETILPGMIAGVLGLICVLSGVVVAFLQFGVHTGVLVLVGALLALLGGCGLWLRFFPSRRMGRSLISDRTVGNIDAEKPELLHQTGEAITILRPAGTALINGQRVDVVSEGTLVEKGTPIKVIAIEGLRVVVRPLSPS